MPRMQPLSAASGFSVSLSSRSSRSAASASARRIASGAASRPRAATRTQPGRRGRKAEDEEQNNSKENQLPPQVVAYSLKPDVEGRVMHSHSAGRLLQHRCILWSASHVALSCLSHGSGAKLLAEASSCTSPPSLAISEGSYEHAALLQEHGACLDPPLQMSGTVQPLFKIPPQWKRPEPPQTERTASSRRESSASRCPPASRGWLGSTPAQQLAESTGWPFAQTPRC